MCSSSDDEDWMFKVEDDILLDEDEEVVERRQKAIERGLKKRSWGQEHSKLWDNGSGGESRAFEVCGKRIFFGEEEDQQRHVWDCARVLAKAFENKTIFPEVKPRCIFFPFNNLELYSFQLSFVCRIFLLAVAWSSWGAVWAYLD